MKKMSLFLVLATVLISAGNSAAQRVVEEIVAIVNDEVITLSEYKREFELSLQQLRAAELSPEEYDKNYRMLKEQLLESMITDKLLLQAAKAADININDQLKTVLDNIKKENNLSSDDDLRRALAQQGIGYEVWIKQYEQLLLKQAVIFTEVERSISMNDSEIIDYYKKHPDEFTVPNEYKLRAVYLSEDNWRGNDLETRKMEISDRIKDGLSLAEAAAEFSDPPLKEAKGELGTLLETDMDKELLQAVAGLEPGTLSSWVKVKTGWYLIQLEEKKNSYRRSFEDSRKDIEEKIYGEKRQKKMEEFLNNLKAKNFVKILKPDPVDY